MHPEDRENSWRGRARGRLLAPVALAATIVITVVIVERGLGPRHSPAPAPLHGPRRGAAGKSGAAAARGARSPAPAATAGAVYVVRPGDSLSVISARTHVPLPSLEALNPGVDPGALHAGQRLRLRRP